jgi:hypothetical protein
LAAGGRSYRDTSRLAASWLSCCADVVRELTAGNGTSSGRRSRCPLLIAPNCQCRLDYNSARAKNFIGKIPSTFLVVRPTCSIFKQGLC